MFNKTGFLYGAAGGGIVLALTLSLINTGDAERGVHTDTQRVAETKFDVQFAQASGQSGEAELAALKQAQAKLKLAESKQVGANKQAAKDMSAVREAAGLDPAEPVAPVKDLDAALDSLK